MKSTMKRKILGAAGVLLAFGVSVAAYGVSGVGSARSDCPGKIDCPLTGDEVCKDRCPLADTARSNCPGKIDCPVTGEPVCRDRCPLDATAETNADKQADVPACCQRKK